MHKRVAKFPISSPENVALVVGTSDCASRTPAVIGPDSRVRKTRWKRARVTGGVASAQRLPRAGPRGRI